MSGVHGNINRGSRLWHWLALFAAVTVGAAVHQHWPQIVAFAYNPPAWFLRGIQVMALPVVLVAGLVLIALGVREPRR